MLLANSWTPEQWVLVITSVVGSLTAATTAVIAALQARRGVVDAKQGVVDAKQSVLDLYHEMRPPSDGVTLGKLIEGIAQVQHQLVAQAAETAGQPVPPSATEIARTLPDATKEP